MTMKNYFTVIISCKIEDVCDQLVIFHSLHTTKIHNTLHVYICQLTQPFQDPKTREMLEVISKVLDSKTETKNEVI